MGPENFFLNLLVFAKGITNIILTTEAMGEVVGNADPSTMDL